MKKKVFLSLILVPLIATVLLWAITSRGCSCVKDVADVTVTIRKITLSEFSFTRSVVDVVVRVENDNPVGAKLDRIEYDIFFGHEERWIWLGQGERAELEIGAGEVADFVVTTNIENQNLLDVIMEAIFGTEPTEMKVDGCAWFTVGPATFEIDFDETDIDPYNPLLDDEEKDEDIEVIEETESGEGLDSGE